jgi:hypothetical protein
MRSPKIVTGILLLVSYNVHGFSTGTGSCFGGEPNLGTAAGGSTHIRTTGQILGPLSDYGVFLIINDDVIVQPNTATAFSPNVDLTWTVRTENPIQYKGILVRAEADDLLEFTMTTTDPLLKVDTLYCPPQGNVVGITQISSVLKSSSSGVLRFDATGTASLDVTVVYRNGLAGEPPDNQSITGYDRFTLNIEAAQVPVDAPVTAPTESPVETPVAVPTESPVKAPVAVPTESPVKAPVAVPTEAPVEAPVAVPTEAPVEAPVAVPTEAPVEAPVDVPVAVPTESPVERPIEAPVEVPTDAPVDAPVKAPTDTPTESPVEAPIKEGTKPPTVKGMGMTDKDSRKGMGMTDEGSGMGKTGMGKMDIKGGRVKAPEDNKKKKGKMVRMLR